MRRRDFITLFGSLALAAPFPAQAQRPRPRIAVLSINSARDDGKLIAAFIDGLRALGYVQGQTVDIDYRYTEGNTAKLATVAPQLVALKPNVVFANAPSPAAAINHIAPDLPIVCPQLSDAVIPALFANYARPGGSVTGLAGTVEDMFPKLLELALDVIPGAMRIGFLINPAGASMPLWTRQMTAAAVTRGVSLQIEEARTLDDLPTAFHGFARRQAQAVVVPGNGLFSGERIPQLALAAGLPTIFAYNRDVELGGLASYGVDIRENNRRAAGYVDKILKGAKPGDLPVEFPTKLLLVVNLKTAKALSIDIPATIVGRADEVIE